MKLKQFVKVDVIDFVHSSMSFLCSVFIRIFYGYLNPLYEHSSPLNTSIVVLYIFLSKLYFTSKLLTGTKYADEHKVFTQEYSEKGNLSKFVTLLSIMLLSLESLVFALEKRNYLRVSTNSTFRHISSL